LSEYADSPSDGTIFDRRSDRYLLISTGWEQCDDQKERVYHVILHVDLVNGKFHIQKDNTEGFARDLVRAGVPHDHIVLAFREPELRQYTGYAVE
jgi:hypothetical protein